MDLHGRMGFPPFPRRSLERCVPRVSVPGHVLKLATILGNELGQSLCGLHGLADVRGGRAGGSTNWMGPMSESAIHGASRAEITSDRERDLKHRAVASSRHAPPPRPRRQRGPSRLSASSVVLLRPAALGACCQEKKTSQTSNFSLK